MLQQPYLPLSVDFVLTILLALSLPLVGDLEPLDVLYSRVPASSSPLCGDPGQPPVLEKVDLYELVSVLFDVVRTPG